MLILNYRFVLFKRHYDKYVALAEKYEESRGVAYYLEERYHEVKVSLLKKKIVFFLFFVLKLKDKRVIKIQKPRKIKGTFYFQRQKNKLK